MNMSNKGKLPARIVLPDNLHRHSDSEETSIKSKSKLKDDTSNLILLRNSKLGKSAPALTSLAKESRASSRKTSRNYHRKSFIINVQPSRCHSPMPCSPVDSPKIHPPARHFGFVPIKRQFTHLNHECKEGRRWSVASLPSSGYETNSGSSNVSSQCSSQEKLHNLHGIPTLDEIQALTQHFSSNDSNPSVDGDQKCRIVRPRSRSLSSPNRSLDIDNDIITMNMLYKERFPNATKQMEKRLKEFIANNTTVLAENLKNSSSDAAPIIRFVHHQVLEVARDCLNTSKGGLITSDYFHEILENLERLLVDTKEKSLEASAVLSSVIKSLLLVISRPARLLECLQFDPEEFYHILQEAEGEAKISVAVKTDIPRYIINKLGINKDPVKELEQSFCESSLESACNSLHPHEIIGKDTFTKNPPSEEDFEVIKLISKGAYGSVYLVRHKETRQRFAMKKIVKNNVMLRNQIEQVFAERDIMSFTDNPFVVSMYCSFETEKYLCLVMEYVEGGDCASLLKAIGPLPPDMARFYFAETVLAVEYLHSYGIVHRDLKPDNLLITALGHIKLTDFGLSKMGLMSLATHLYEVYLDKDTKQFSDKQVFGTPEYIAPEVILRQGYGKPVDWWAMGVILYEFLLGCVPFFGETPEELFAHTVNDDIEWPDENDWFVEPEAKDIITALLQQNPRERLGTGSAHEVKDHAYFHNVDWNSLLRKKAEFIPQLASDEDTSYFDSRVDRYKHDIMEESIESDDSVVLGSFSSCSDQFRKVTSHMNSHTDVSDTAITGEHSGHIFDDSAGVHPLFNCDIENALSSDIFLDISKSKNSLSTPESSQTESDVSPQIQRKKCYTSKDSVPRFSISLDETPSSHTHTHLDVSRDLFPDSKKDKIKKQGLQLPDTPPSVHGHRHRSRSLFKSSHNSVLSLHIPPEGFPFTQSLASPGGSSTASSRDASPCQELMPIINNLKPPVVIRRNASGFGFTVHTVRVYYGDTDFYTMHHLVMAVDSKGPAFEAGLRPGNLITHINGELIQGLYHTQVLQLLLCGEDKVTLRVTPLEETSIRTDGRKRQPSLSKLAASRKSSYHRSRRMKRDIHLESKRRQNKPTLFSKINSRRHACDIKHPSNVSSPSHLSTSRSFHTHGRSPLAQESISGQNSPPLIINTSLSSSPNRLSVVQTEVMEYSSHSSSSSSSNSPSSNSQYQRPSSLHGLKHKIAVSKNAIHCGNRRKSVGHIPLSPLARTPSPSPVPPSPTRSPSPLVFPPGHQPGSSNTTQSYSPGTLSTLVSTPISTGKKTYTRPKGTDPRSPLLRRALSPDRLHTRNLEGKGNSISPLCDAALKVTVHAPRITVTSKSHVSTIKKQLEKQNQLTTHNRDTIDDSKIVTQGEKFSHGNLLKKVNSLKLTSSSTGAQVLTDKSHSTAPAEINVNPFDNFGNNLPLIKEEKDSPPGVKINVPSLE